MTITSEVYKDIYTGDGSTTVFPYTFKILADADLKITKYTISDGTEELLALTTDYTISDAGEASGGNVTLTGTAPSSLYKIIIHLGLALTQEVDYIENDDFPAATHEEALDRLTLQNKQQQEQLDRVVLQDPSATSSVNFPPPEDTKVIGWDGTDLANLDNPATAAAASAAAALVSENAAAASETAAGASETAAETAETNAETAETNAETAETNAAASAAAAAASAASGLYESVTSKAFGDSPIVPLLTEEGTLYWIDTSGGNVVINLSALSVYGEDMKYAFVKGTADGNTITVNRGGSDTIDGGTSFVISTQYEVTVIVGDSATSAWVKAIQATSIVDGSVTMAKLADLATMKVIGRTAGGTGVPSAVSILDEDDMTSDSATAVATQQSIKAYADAIPSGFQNVDVITSTGTWTRPAGVDKVLVKVVGGGGAGVKGYSTGYISGAGGGAGGYAEGLVEVTGDVTVTVGAGGAATGTDVSGGAGGATSSFAGETTIQATGGAAGTTGSSTRGSHGGVGGVGSAGDINQQGGQGGNGSMGTTNIFVSGGCGGDSYYGGGGKGNSGDSDSSASGLANSGGGGGGASSGTGSQATKGSGGSGIVIVYY